MIKESHHKGFSLVELSIVLVILGLLTGGILAGQSLIRAAQLRSVSVEHSTYTSAVQTFRDKYFAIPGDMTNATAFWGSAGGTGNFTDGACNWPTQTAGHAGTCNGNGTLDIAYDARIFWEHLRLAGLVEGSFFPWPLGTNNAITGVHMPLSKVGKQAGWFACYTGRGNFGRPSRNMFVLSNAPWSSSGCSAGLSAGLGGDEAYGIDVKMDDGQAGYGNMTATNSYDGGTGCIAWAGTFSGETLPADYILNSSLKNCHLYFALGL